MPITGARGRSSAADHSAFDHSAFCGPTSPAANAGSGPRIVVIARPRTNLTPHAGHERVVGAGSSDDERTRTVASQVGQGIVRRSRGVSEWGERIGRVIDG
jgi:hypothetical protein